jgi:hypothetical protein
LTRHPVFAGLIPRDTRRDLASMRWAAARSNAAVREEITEHFVQRKIRRYKSSFLISFRSFD